MPSGFTDIELEIFGHLIFIPAFALQMGLALLFGLLVGIEREIKGKHASLRTFSFISAGSCLFTLLSVQAASGDRSGFYDMTRVAAQIVTGVGFLGGGVIFKTVDRIEGITTAALIWVVAALGMACGFNAIAIAVWSFLLFAFVHIISAFLYWIIYAFRDQDEEPKVMVG